ncbi:MAG: Ryanodine receptor Ryr [Clostridia bacterium]|nr:Ryanodine receptor Ryr [Clostridia bacterium]
MDTSGVVLGEDVNELLEQLARNTHEVWARERMAQGWTYGAERDDHRRQHPCLVPYEELSEAEKEYDRSTAVQVLKLITKLGYRISKTE